MKNYRNIVVFLSKTFDKLSAICMFAIMLLVVLNVILRVAFNSPILGTYEYVNILTAIMVGFGISHCALRDGHIAVDILTERFSNKVKIHVDAVIQLVSLVFWALAGWHLVKYAKSVAQSGIVLPTTQISLAPLLLILAVAFLVLCLVIGFKFTDTIAKEVSSQ